MEDGVLWSASPDGLWPGRSRRRRLRPGQASGAATFSRPSRPAGRHAGGRHRQLHAASRGQSLTYTIARTRTPELVNVRLAPIPSGARGLYYVLAAVGIFSLLVGAAVRVRRPDNQATLHFFWLTIAFFGVLAFSFSGRFDTLDWFFYWADAWAMLMLPPLFVHFTLVFPGSPRQLDPQRRRPNRGAAPVSARDAPRRRPCRGAAACA